MHILTTRMTFVHAGLVACSALVCWRLALNELKGETELNGAQKCYMVLVRLGAACLIVPR